MSGPATLYQAGNHAGRPASGSGCVLYSCTDHDLVYRDDGTSWSTFMTLVGGSGGDIATDTIWDAAGDVAVGSGANTAVRLPIGAAGGALSRINGAVAWNSGTSMPGAAAAGDRFWRTDLGLEFEYDGTRWLTTKLYDEVIPAVVVIPLTASSTPCRAALPQAGVMGVWVEDIWMTFHVIAGTALSASHKWTCPFQYAPAGTTLGTITIDSGALNAWRTLTTAVNLAIATTQFEIEVGATKTGTPGNLWILPRFSYRLIGT